VWRRTIDPHYSAFVLHAFLLSLAQLGDRRVLAVLAKSLALTLVLLLTFGAALWWSAVAAARWAGWESWSGLAGVAALLGGVLLGWLIFRAVAIFAVGVFADDVVAAVEARHYPDALARARPVPLGRSIAMGVAAAGRTVAINLAALPIYLLLLATGVGTPIGFFAVNALLLGRDLGDMVAARHLTRPALPAFRRATRLPRLLLGAAGTALLLVPIANLLAPIVAAAMATHLFHRRLAP
jgi:CysZ protein